MSDGETLDIAEPIEIKAVHGPKGWTAHTTDGKDTLPYCVTGARAAAWQLAQRLFGHARLDLKQTGNALFRATQRIQKEEPAPVSPVRPSPTAFGDWTGD
jgi:hypothetical protein